MTELQITIQILAVVILVILVVIVGFLLYMLRKINKALDSLLDIVTAYEKIKTTLAVLAEGPAKGYIEGLKTVMSFVTPLLTKHRKHE